MTTEPTELKPLPISPVRRMGAPLISPIHAPVLVPGTPPASNQTPIPFDQWPLWARVMAYSKRPEDTGLGDTVAHWIGDTRSEAFKSWFEKKFGTSCGCTERQRWINRRFPYL